MTSVVRYSGRSSKRVPRELTEAEIHRIALGYLNRFDASTAALRKVLLARMQRSIKQGSYDTAEAEQRTSACRQWIEQLLTRFQGSGVLDDNRYTVNMVASLRRRGVSARGIQKRLATKGIPAATLHAALAQVSADPFAQGSEIEAATAYARRRKLGRFGGSTDRRRLHKDLAKMARAGFDYEVAVRTLGQKIDDDGDF